jgi:hypothetical protein
MKLYSDKSYTAPTGTGFLPSIVHWDMMVLGSLTLTFFLHECEMSDLNLNKRERCRPLVMFLGLSLPYYSN